MSDFVEIRRSTYHDSVALMQVSQQVRATPGVQEAQVGMGTELNLGLLREAGFAVPPEVGANDLVVALRAEDAQTLDAARARLESLLAGLHERAVRAGDGQGASAGGAAPRTIGSAARRSHASIALVSTPGEHAVLDALDAIGSGLSVLLFSDNVPVADEIRLKDAAAARNLIVMGPDCGSAVVNGVALGFANVTRPGRIGIVAASGTGAQQVMSLLDLAGEGISHCLGLGGRDLSAEVGGRAARQALAALAADPATEHVVIVSKPADPGVVAALDRLADDLGLPVTWATLGRGRPDLTAAVETTLRAVGAPVPTWPSWPSPGHDAAPGGAPAPARGSALRGLFCGGTLAEEALVVAEPVLGPIASNVPLEGSPRVGARDLGTGPDHLVLDLGDDELTAGRAHPMIDPALRLELIRAVGEDAYVGVLLVDLVLGHGAHPDPADELAEALRTARSAARARGAALPVVVSLVGTEADPQGLGACARVLAEAGAEVFTSNAAAVRAALAHLSGRPPQPPAPVEAADGGMPDQVADPGVRPDPRPGPEPATPPTATPAPLGGLLAADPEVVTAGAGLLADALRAQAVPVTEVDWRPPWPGVGAALAKVLADPRREAANALALARMTAAQAELVRIAPASEVLGLAPGEFLHSGPPLTWERASGPMRGALVGAALVEGLAGTPEEAEELLAGPGVSLAPCHSRGAVGPMAGVVSPSMWMFELHDPVHGTRAYCSLNEGLGKVLRYGAYGPEVIARLEWMRDVLGPVLAEAVRRHGPVDVKAYLSQMLQMGDEGHNRNRSATLMFLRDLLPHLVGQDRDRADLAEVCRFVGGNDHFALNLVMPACKLAMAAAADIPGSSLVVTMARNGTDFGIQLSGTGDAWFTGPAQVPEGLFLGSYGPEDANPDIGDSAITETAGMGGFVMAAAPAIVRLVGGDVDFALSTTTSMYEITLGENPALQVPILEFRGAPAGIDAVAVARTGLLPQINTGMAGRIAGTGQVGAGLVQPPAEAFVAALQALAERVPPTTGE